MSKLLKISDVSKMLNLVDSESKKPLNHILRYWEKEFKEIKPRKINNRRYYTPNQVEIIRLIKFLLKTQGLTISGVKKFLKFNAIKLDDHHSHSLKAAYYTKSFKTKSKLLLDKIRKIQSYGKKNAS